MANDRNDAAKARAADKAKASSDVELADLLDQYANDIEAEGRAVAPQMMREAAHRLRRPTGQH